MRVYILSLVALAVSVAGRCQQTIFSVGSSSALTIKSGTVFGADSLVLTPGTDLTLSSNNIQVSHTAVNLAPVPGINRVYNLASQVSFTGTIQLYYQLSELNGNTESALQYTDSSVGSFWLASASGTVNTSLHYVQQVASARPFIGLTASTQGTVLALSLVSFAGLWQGDQVGLEWVINQTHDAAEYVVESSTDGISWKAIGTVPGQTGDGLYTYRFNDTDPLTGTVFYRLQINKASGLSFYSYIVKMQKEEDLRVRLIALSKAVSVYFDGGQPTGVRILSATGETIRIDRTSRSHYEFSGLLSGVYFLQYELNGRLGARSFLVN